MNKGEQKRIKANKSVQKYDLCITGREMDYILKRSGLPIAGNSSFSEFINRSDRYYYLLKNGIGNIPLFVADALVKFMGEEMFVLAQQEYREKNNPPETKKNVERKKGIELSEDVQTETNQDEVQPC